MTTASLQKPFWLSVGLKMMIGVGLVSNLSIGLLIYVNFMAFSEVAEKTNVLLEVSSSMNDHLRSNIFELQKKYLEIPKLLKSDASDEIMEWIRKNYKVETEDQITGRNNYSQLFDRSERRDITKGGIIVQAGEGYIYLSRGLMDEKKGFLDAISRIRLTSDAPLEESSTIKAFIESAGAKADNGDALKQKIAALTSLLADDAIAAELVRNEILYSTEDIEKKKAGLIQYRLEKRNTIVLIAAIAVLMNLVILHFMARGVVEMPLKHLTHAVEKINNGELVEIPFLKRKDRIGILALSLKDFQRALLDIRKEDDRKKEEKDLIQKLVEDIGTIIQELQQKAIAMKKRAITVNSLASDTKNETNGASFLASTTVKRTQTVYDSTRELESAVEDISVQVANQNCLTKDIHGLTQGFRKDISELTSASEEINDIVTIVKAIAGQTRLLALNATIEAARAGDAGRGFAVVAREVKELSIKTETANAEIAGKINSIQKVSTAIIENTRQFETSIERLSQAGCLISNAVEQQTAVTTGIASNADATTTDMKDLSRRILKVAEAALTTSELADDVQFHSEDIAAELSSLLEQTRTRLSMVSMEKPSKEPEELIPFPEKNEFPEKNDSHKKAA